MSKSIGFRKPDLNAPRFRSPGLNLLNKTVYNKFIEKYPQYSNITIEKFKDIITTFNQNMWKTVLEERDGIELPCGLGHVFLGACQPPTKKKTNTDFARSIQAGKLVLHRNFSTDSFLGKVFYSNYLSAYRFKNKQIWEFSAGRDFSRAASVAFKSDFKKYIQVENNLKITNLYKIKAKKHWFKTRVVNTAVEYNEFDMN